MKARVLQAQLLDNHKYIVDAVPKGDVVRFITQPIYPELPIEYLPSNAVVTPREPELEDAFMSFLHQAQQQQIDVKNSNENALLESQKQLAETPQSAIIVKDLVRKFGDFTAVANTSFDVQRGEIFGLLGPNGAGKTTTFRMLCGLLPASSGTLEVAGMNLRTARAQARAKIGYVSQKFALYSNLTVLDNLKF